MQEPALYLLPNPHPGSGESPFLTDPVCAKASPDGLVSSSHTAIPAVSVQMLGDDSYFTFFLKKRNRCAFNALAARVTAPPDPWEQPGYFVLTLVANKLKMWLLVLNYPTNRGAG